MIANCTEERFSEVPRSSYANTGPDIGLGVDVAHIEVDQLIFNCVYKNHILQRLEQLPFNPRNW